MARKPAQETPARLPSGTQFVAIVVPPRRLDGLIAGASGVGDPWVGPPDIGAWRRRVSWVHEGSLAGNCRVGFRLIFG